MLPILEFSFARGLFWARFRPAVRSKYRGSCSLFQKETDFGYDLCSSWFFAWYLDPSHPAKQFIFSGWVLKDDTIQCSLGHVYASDGLYSHASSTATFDVKVPYYKINTSILQGLVIYYAFSRVSNASWACP